MPKRVIPWARTRYSTLNGGKLIVAAVVAIGLMWALLVYRAHVNSASDAKVCRKIDKVTSALIQFVQESPVPKNIDMRIQRDRFLTKMRGAACDPHNLPSATP